MFWMALNTFVHITKKDIFWDHATRQTVLSEPGADYTHHIITCPLLQEISDLATALPGNQKNAHVSTKLFLTIKFAGQFYWWFLQL